MIKKIFFSRTAAPIGTIFSKEHPQDKEFQMCSSKVPGVIYGHAPGA